MGSDAHNHFLVSSCTSHRPQPTLVTDLRGIQVCRDDFGLCVRFGVRLAGEEERVVLDDAWERLEAFVN